MRKILLPLLLVSVGFASCDKDEQDLSGMPEGRGFFPTDIGKYIVYDYDSTYYNDELKTNVVRRGQVRYSVTDTFRDNAGRLTAVIKVQRRANDSDPYAPNDVVYVNAGENHVEVKQKTLSLIKLVFPVSNGVRWDGNALVPERDADFDEYRGADWNYVYSNYDQSFDPGNNLYEHTVTVNQADGGQNVANNRPYDTASAAYRNYGQEVYAYGVGMVYRERIYWQYTPAGSGGSGYPKGYSVTMKAVENN